MDSDIIHYLVELPMTAFTPLAIAAGVDAWTWLLRQRPAAQVSIIGEISAGWLETIKSKKGLFSNSMESVLALLADPGLIHNSYTDPFVSPVQYSPSDKKVMDLELAKARRLLRPHLLLIQVLSSQFQAVKYSEPGIMMSIIRLMMRSVSGAAQMRYMSQSSVRRNEVLTCSARTPSLARSASRSCYLGSRSWRAAGSRRCWSSGYAIDYSLLLSLGSLFVRSKLNILARSGQAEFQVVLR
jgi:hypothetical protein